MRIFTYLAIWFCLASCSLFSWSAEEKSEPRQEIKTEKQEKAQSIGSSRVDSVELKQAQLSAKIESLEEDTRKLAQQVKLLENSIRLGLTLPSNQANSKLGPMPPIRIKGIQNEGVDDRGFEKPSKQEKISSFTEPSEEEVGQAIAAAQDLFQQGRYGRAIVVLSEVENSKRVKEGDGSVEYWVATAWARMKEFNEARKRFLRFLDIRPKSPWASRVKLELARAELNLDMRETAVNRLKSIIKDHPYEDISEVAKMELTRIRSNF